MPQCKQVHPNSPHQSVFLCIKESGHDGKHYTYDSFGKSYKWGQTIESDDDWFWEIWGL